MNKKTEPKIVTDGPQTSILNASLLQTSIRKTFGRESWCAEFDVQESKFFQDGYSQAVCQHRKKINLILFQSDLVGHNNMHEIHREMLLELEQHFIVQYYDSSQVLEVQKEEGLILVWIGSGGTEEQFRAIFPQWYRDVILLNDGISNSLAASLEIASWLKRQGVKFKVVHDSPKRMVRELKLLSNLYEAKNILKDLTIGVLGEPSDWLIGSAVDEALAYKKWGVKFFHVNLQEVVDNFDMIRQDESQEKTIQELAERFLGHSCKQVEGTLEEIKKAVCLYLALKTLVEKYHFKAITLRCFDLIKPCNTTGCLALGWLNRDGIIAGCEGDMQAILTLVLAKAITGRTGFMANPSRIDQANNQIVLSHCMVDPSLTQGYVIRSHYETQMGIAYQGLLPEGEVTIFKVGGTHLDEAFIASASLVENTHHSNFCRTQALFQLKDKSVEYFLKAPIGNHHIVLWGNQVKVLKQWLELD